jgi:hypothetical protein
VLGLRVRVENRKGKGRENNPNPNPNPNPNSDFKSNHSNPKDEYVYPQLTRNLWGM